MTDFQLDTSGVVRTGRTCADGVTRERDTYWSDLKPFHQGALEAALRELYTQQVAEALAAGSQEQPRPYCFSDLAPATLARIMADCERAQASPCTSAVDSDPFEFGNSEEDGDNFWNARTKGWLSGFPPLTLYLADDGLIHVREAA